MIRKPWSGRAMLGVAIGALAIVGATRGSDETSDVGPVSRDAGSSYAPPSENSRTVVFAGGCFWGVQAVFQHVKGVEVSTSGYAGGSAETAKYEITSTGRTGHAESVRVVFDPSVVSLYQLLDVFFTVAHDPMQLNRQGPDVGPQYRSAIFTTSDAQETEVRDYVSQLGRSHAYSRKIVTEVGPLDGFYPAEEYHQDYLIHHPNSPYIRTNDIPKLKHLKRAYPELWRNDTAPWRAKAANAD